MRERTHRCLSRWIVVALVALGPLTAVAPTQAAPVAPTTAPGGIVAARAEFDVLARDQGASQVNGQLVTAFTSLAGSKENAQSLISGLRTGDQITLTSTSAGGGTAYTTINPPANGMSWGDIYVGLSLARESLNQQGIGNPSPPQLRDALSGILTQRTGGATWAAIAQSLSVKLGPIVTALRATNAQLAGEQSNPPA